MNPGLTVEERARLTISGMLIPPPVKRGRPVAHVSNDVTVAACRAWQQALASARDALKELAEAERKYIAACEVDKARASRRRVPPIDPYRVPKEHAA